jgi:ribosomal-protein-alanine N-acetyltransferase
MFVIRRFRSEDLPQVIALVEMVFRERYEVPMYMDLFTSWPDGFRVVDYAGSVVAFLLGMVSGPRQARVLLLAVHPQFRGHGLGSRLLWEFMQGAAALPADSITLEVRVSNQRAVEFYQRMGFSIAGLIPTYYKDGENAHLMTKPLGAGS